MNDIDKIPDMPALRAAIDAQDAELIRLFARRHALIERAAKIKATEGLPAHVDWRVEEVVANARSNAAAAGLDADLFGSIWRQLVKAAIVQEDRHLKETRE